VSGPNVSVTGDDRHSRNATLPKYPLLPAWQGIYGGHPQTVIFCKYCLIYHRHGAGGYGHRVCHCAPAPSPYRREDRGTPYDATGYVLVAGGDAPPEVQADLDWQAKHRFRFSKRVAAAEHYAVDESGRVVRTTPEPRPERSKPAKRVRR
jgi:hypothetical protein